MKKQEAEHIKFADILKLKPNQKQEKPNLQSDSINLSEKQLSNPLSLEALKKDDQVIGTRSEVDLLANDQVTDQVENVNDQLLSLPNSGSLPKNENLAYQNSRLPNSDSLLNTGSLPIAGSLLSMSSLLITGRLPNSGSLPKVTLWDGLEEVKGYSKIPNLYLDKLARLLDPTEQAIYLQLFRLSWGYGKELCNIGLPKLAERANVGKSTAQLAIKRLLDKKLIEKIDWSIGKGKDQGTIYRLPLPLSLLESGSLPVNNSLPKSNSLPYSDTIKDHDDDHDDLKRQDHHLTRNVQPTNLSEHEKAVMMMYQKITDNPWTKADSDTYTKVKAIPIEKIEIALRLASERAKNRPNSFAFFIKEILSVSSPKKQSRSQQKKAMEAIMNNIRNSKVGSSNYTISDFAFDVKEACIREDVAFDNNIFDELLSKQRS
ncbi:MAG: hypothetical protein WAQ98_23350 [Blastocatellia bacterium]